MTFDRLKGRIVAADANGERLLVTIQLDKIEPVGVGARAQIVSHLFWPDVERLEAACRALIDSQRGADPKTDEIREAQSALVAIQEHRT